VARTLSFKWASKELRRRMPTPTNSKIGKLSRQLWEFGEQVRLESLNGRTALQQDEA